MIKTKANRLTFRCSSRNHPAFARALAALARVYRDRSGTSLFEFALCASILLSFWLGLMQCCLALYAYNVVSDAARRATRYAVVRGSSCTGMPDCGITAAQLQTYVQGVALPGITNNQLSATVTWYQASISQPTSWTACAGQCNDPGNAVKIKVSYNFPLNIPFWKNKTLSLSSTSQMVISN